MKLSENMNYYLVGVPKQARLWPSEEEKMLRETIRATNFKEYRGNPYHTSTFDPKKITVKPYGRKT